MYADEVFVVNFAMNYILLLAAAKLCGAGAKRWRMAVAAAAGGGYAVAAALRPFLGNPVIAGAIGLAIAVGAFGMRGVARRAVAFFAVSAAVAGLAMAMFGGRLRMNLGVLAIAFGACYAAVSLALQRVARPTGGYSELEIRQGTRTIRLRALRDSGNSLKDPVTGASVAVAPLTDLLPLFERETREVLQTLNKRGAHVVLSDLGALANAPSFRLIPYNAVGVRGGLLLAFRPDGVTVDGASQNLLVAVSPTALADNVAYSALINY
ncbi:MAG: sigma-E processing peptidase SpoIIGA [Oscillospiraceae bacterium]|nr:sigma-E processing peptidase SpoIIGA [Oscillospiraceae bacterium]